MEARGILHKVPATDHSVSLHLDDTSGTYLRVIKQREQYNQQQQQQQSSGVGNTDSYGNRANGGFDSDGTQIPGTTNEPPLPPRKDHQQGYTVGEPTHGDNMTGDNQQQQRMNDNGGGAGAGNAGQHFDKPSDAYSSAGQVTAGGTDASRYDQQRMEAPPQGGGASVGMRNFDTPSDAMQTGAGQGAAGAGSTNTGRSGHGHHAAGPAAAAGVVGATEASRHDHRGAGPADTSMGPRGYNQDQNHAGDRTGNFGGGPVHGQNAGGPASAAGAAAGQGAMGAGRTNDTSAGAGKFDQDRTRAQERHFGANAGVGSGAGPGHQNHTMGPAAAVGAAGLEQGNHRGRNEPLSGSGRANNQTAYDAENNLPTDGRTTGANPTMQGGVAPGTGSVASGNGTAQVIVGTLQQAAGTLLNNDNMITKGLERESKGMAKRDPAQAQALQQEAEVTRSQGKH